MPTKDHGSGKVSERMGLVEDTSRFDRDLVTSTTLDAMGWIHMKLAATAATASRHQQRIFPHDSIFPTLNHTHGH
jgi:hypothetical protein